MCKVELRNVTKIIKKNTIINNISLKLEGGRIIGFKGINGSGKTMLMRLVSGLILPTSGEVYIDGKQLHKDISFPDSIGLLLENPEFLDSYSGFDNLKMLSSIKEKISDKDINNIIAQVGLNPNDKKNIKNIH